MLPQQDLLTRITHTQAVAVTPSDSVDLPKGQAMGGLYVTVTGNVAFDLNGATIALLAVTANTRLPFAATRVRATGTTATVLALY